MFTGLTYEEIPKFADELEMLIAKPLKRTHTGKYLTPTDVLLKCMKREWQCWVSFTTEIDCVFITYIENHPTGYKSFVVDLVGGSHIDKWLAEAWDTFKDYARSQGCNEIKGAGRKGWLRKLKEVEDSEIETHLTFAVEL